MVATAPQELLTSVENAAGKPFTLEDFMQNPPQDMEWVDGELIEKTGMTLRHSLVQGRLVSGWKAYAVSSGQQGEVYPEVPCRTTKQGRRPDVAYLPAELVAQFGREKVLPQSFPLIAEVASPDDRAEELFAKAIEYLESGAEEVWLVFPEARLILVKTIEHSWQLSTLGQSISTQKVLQGFSAAVDELFQ